MTQFCLFISIEDISFEAEVANLLLGMGFMVGPLATDGQICSGAHISDLAAYMLSYLITPKKEGIKARDLIEEIDARFLKLKIRHLGIVLSEFKTNNVSWIQPNMKADYGISIVLGGPPKLDQAEGSQNPPAPKDPDA